MAMIDYGVIVIKNGVIINRDCFFQDMLREVGWIDSPRKLYEDCDYFGNCGEYKEQSWCYTCPRALVSELNTSPDDMKYIIDCKGNKYGCNSGERTVDGNYFAYIGDKKLTIAFYKFTADIFIDKKFSFSIPDIREYHERSYYRIIEDHMIETNKTEDLARITVKNIEGECINLLSLKYKNDFYDVIYGYGIDNNIETFDKIKHKYLGSKVANRVDAILRKYVKDYGAKDIYDTEDCRWIPFYYSTDDGKCKFYNFIYDAIEYLYGVESSIVYDGCDSVDDSVDALNYYFGRKRFKSVYHSEFQKYKQYLG